MVCADATPQNVCNAAWAMSMMRFRPQQAFAERLQRVLHEALDAAPAVLHPQNIGDMVQARLLAPPVVHLPAAQRPHACVPPCAARHVCAES